MSDAWHAAAGASLLLEQEHGVMSAAKTSVVSAAETSALSAAKASALKTSASSHISMVKITTCARLRRADVVVGGIEMREDADVFDADTLAADNADVLAADNADVLAADTTDVLAADNKEAPVPGKDDDPGEA